MRWLKFVPGGWREPARALPAQRAVGTFANATFKTNGRARVYQRRLKPGGLLLLHISNRVLNLKPVARGYVKVVPAFAREGVLLEALGSTSQTTN